MAELSDTDSSFDLDITNTNTNNRAHNDIVVTDDDDIFQDDPLGFDPQRYNNNNNNNSNHNNGISLSLRNNFTLLNKIKSWFDRKVLTQSRLNKLNNRGIPLYDLDSNGDPDRNIHSGNHNNDDFVPFNPISSPSFNGGWFRGRKMFLLIKCIKWIIIIGLLITFMIHVVLKIVHFKKNQLNKNNDISNIFSTTNKHLYNSRINFNPNRLYSNGTHEFYPLTIVINLRYMYPELITKEQSPFLYDMIYPSGNELNKMEMNTIVGELEPNFPFDSSLQDWCMVTGNYPIDNGLFKNDIKGLTIENVTAPIWNNINETFVGDNKFIVKSFGWTHLKDDENPCHDVKHTNSKSKINEVIRLIDIVDQEERPQLILLTMDDLKDSVINGENRVSIDRKINQMDKLLHKLVYELRHRNLLLNLTNIIILSDSGGSGGGDETTKIGKIELRQLFKLDEENGGKDSKKKYKNLLKKIDQIDNHEGRLISMRIKDTNDRNHIYKMLKTNIDPNQVSLYIKDKLPKEYNINFQKSPSKIDKTVIYESMDDIWLIPRNGYLLVEDMKDIGIIQKNSIFIGQGPYFHDIITNYMGNNRYLLPFNNIGIYDIISSIIGLNVKDRNPNRDKYTIQYTSKLSHYIETEDRSENKIGSITTIDPTLIADSISTTTTTSSSPIASITTNSKTTTLIGTKTSSSSSNSSSSSSSSTGSTDPLGQENNNENDNNNNGENNHDFIESVIDYLKGTEEEILDTLNDLIDDIIMKEPINK